MSHLTHNRSISETSLSRQSTALMPTTKKETKHHKTETIALANKQTTPWFGTPLMTCRREMEQALFLHPHSPHRTVMHYIVYVSVQSIDIHSCHTTISTST